MSAGGGRAGARGADLGLNTGRDSSPRPGSAIAVMLGPPTSGSAALSSLSLGAPVQSPAGPWAGAPRGEDLGPPSGSWLLRHTHSLTPSTDQQTQRPTGQADTQWHTRSCGHTDTLIHGHAHAVTHTHTHCHTLITHSDTVTHSVVPLVNTFFADSHVGIHSHTPAHINSHIALCCHTYWPTLSTPTLSL